MRGFPDFALRAHPGYGSSMRHSLGAAVRPRLGAALVGWDLAIIDALLVVPFIAETFLAGAHRTRHARCASRDGIAARGRLPVSNGRGQREREGRNEQVAW